MSQTYELTGKIILINDTQTFASGFQKRTFVIQENSEKYPQTIPFDAIKDGCDRLDAYQIGDEITVSFNVRGNEHNGRYFVNLQAWKITRVGGEPSRPVQKSMPPAPAQVDNSATDNVDDDIPFAPRNSSLPF